MDELLVFSQSIHTSIFPFFGCWHCSMGISSRVVSISCYKDALGEESYLVSLTGAASPRDTYIHAIQSQFILHQPR